MSQLEGLSARVARGRHSGHGVVAGARIGHWPRFPDPAPARGASPLEARQPRDRPQDPYRRRDRWSHDQRAPAPDAASPDPRPARPPAPGGRRCGGSRLPGPGRQLGDDALLQRSSQDRRCGDELLDQRRRRSAMPRRDSRRWDESWSCSTGRSASERSRPLAVPVRTSAAGSRLAGCCALSRAAQGRGARDPSRSAASSASRIRGPALRGVAAGVRLDPGPQRELSELALRPPERRPLQGPRSLPEGRADRILRHPGRRALRPHRRSPGASRPQRRGRRRWWWTPLEIAARSGAGAVVCRPGARPSALRAGARSRFVVTGSSSGCMVRNEKLEPDALAFLERPEARVHLTAGDSDWV